MSALAKMSAYARKKSKQPPDWHVWLYEAVEGGVLLTGAVCPPKTRGENKGRPNFRKKDANTIRRVFVSSKEYDAALQKASA